MDKFQKRETSFCSFCSKPFKIKNSFNIYCSDICQESVNKKIKEKTHQSEYYICKDCGLEFKCTHYKTNTLKCTPCQAAIRKKKVEQEKVKRNLENLKNPKEKKLPKLSVQEANRRLEFKRVMDKGAWDHYLKGRNWDRI